MSTKSSTKRSPRAMPVETIITRFKSSQRVQQLDKGFKSSQRAQKLEKEKPKNVKSTTKSKSNPKNPTKTRKQKLPTKCNAGLTAFMKAPEETKTEFYPEKRKRETVNRKIVLAPKHRLKVIGGTNSCNKRKLHLPRKEIMSKIKRARYSSLTPSDSDSNSPKHKSHSYELNIRDMVSLIEEEGGLDEEDLLEILTCPSPVWWEDPPSGYVEDPIFARRKSAEQMSVKNQLLDEQIKETERGKDIVKDATVTKTSKDNLDVSKLNISVENRGENFITKRCKLESLLGNIKDKVKKSNADHKVGKNTCNKLNIKLNPKNNEKKDKVVTKHNKSNDGNIVKSRSIDINNLQVGDKDDSKSGEVNKNSSCFDDDQILDLSDDEILTLENIDIPTAPNNTARDNIEEKIKNKVANKGSCDKIKEKNITNKVVLANKSSCDKIKDKNITNKVLITNKGFTDKIKYKVVSKHPKGIDTLSNKSEDNENKQVKSSAFSFNNKLTVCKNIKVMKTLPNDVKTTIPCIRVKKFETLTTKPTKKCSKEIVKKIISNDKHHTNLNNNVANKAPVLAMQPKSKSIESTEVPSDGVKSAKSYVRVRKMETLMAKTINNTKDTSTSYPPIKIRENMLNYGIIKPIKKTVELSDNVSEDVHKAKDKANDNISEVQYVSLENKSVDLSRTLNCIGNYIPKDYLSENNNLSVKTENSSSSVDRNIDSRRYSLESEESERNMSEEYLDMSVFDEDDKMDLIIHNNHVNNNEFLPNSQKSQCKMNTTKVSDSQIVIREDTCNEIKYSHDNNDSEIMIDECIDYKEKFPPLILQASTESQMDTSETDTKDPTDYVDLDNDINLRNNNKIKTAGSETTKASDQDNGRINYYYKQRKYIQRTKKKSKSVSRGKKNNDKGGNKVNKECVSCKVKYKSIVIGDNTIKYCLLCSSIFDTEECKYCIGKHNTRCSCKVHETEGLECDVCGIKVSRRSDFIKHFNSKHCS